MDERDRRVAENEILFRQVNEWRTRGLGAGEAQPVGEFEILCECGDTRCMDRVVVTIEAYELARSEPTDFLLKPGHEHPEFETVIETYERFELVRKTGEAAVLATKRDPRS